MNEVGYTVHTAHATLLILAGGRSLRFGSDKSMLKIGGNSIIEMLIKQMKDLFDAVLIATDIPGKFNLPEVLELVDHYPGRGPLGGVHAGLLACHTPWLFVMACDMPHIERSVVNSLLCATQATSAMAVLPSHECGYEPLCALYHRDTLGIVEMLLTLSKGRPGMLELLREIDVHYVQTENCFFNINTRKDAARVNMQKHNGGEVHKDRYIGFFAGE